jgi:hypothetical protein
VGGLRFNGGRLELVCLPHRLLGWVALELEQKKMKYFILVLILLMLLAVSASGIQVNLHSEQMFPALTFKASISTTGVILLTGMECNVQNIDWGVLNPGQQADRNVSVRAVGNGTLSLSYNLSDWHPSEAAQYLGLTWDYNGSVVGQVWYPIIFTLTVDPLTVGIRDFSFNINIYGM